MKACLRPTLCVASQRPASLFKRGGPLGFALPPLTPPSLELFITRIVEPLDWMDLVKGPLSGRAVILRRSLGPLTTFSVPAQPHR